MSEATNENQLQRRIWKEVIRRWPNAWLFHPVGGPFQMPGVPDLLICAKGLLIGMEIKHVKPGESVDHARQRATAQQRRQIRLINAAGGMAGVVVSVEEAVGMVERAFVKQKVLIEEEMREQRG